MKKILLIILALGLVGGAVGFYMYQKPHKDMAKEKAQHTLSAMQLIGAFGQNEAEATTKFSGQIVEVSGTISAIVPGDDKTIQIMLSSEDPMSSVSCNMQDDRDKILATKVKKGDQIVIKGQCSGYLMDVVMDRCVIVNKK